MRWTVLTDNRCSDSRLSAEHGLSVLLQTGEHSILLDTGAGDAFLRNAAALGIDLGAIDYVFISHGHNDHAGGLRHFLELNRRAKVIVSSEAIGRKFFSKRGRLHSITPSWPNIPAERLFVINETCEIADGLLVGSHIPQVHPAPQGNRNLFVDAGDGVSVPDDFCHELTLYADGLLFTGCAHRGLENILSACPRPVHTVVGGFHLLDGYESDEALTALAGRLKTNYPGTRFYTGHCTGSHVFDVMKQQLGEQLQAFCCGYQGGDAIDA